MWPDNWPIVMMWLRLQTQWRTSMGGPIGLDYSVLPWFFKLYGTDNEKELLEGLQVMEAAALSAMSKEG